MGTKVHFLCIPDQDFAKIITYASLGYLNEIITKYKWDHFTGWKITICEEYPAELLSQLITHNISYERKLIYLNPSL